MPVNEDHEVTKTLHEDVIYPAHEKRTESSLFRENKEYLVAKLDTPCFICGSKENREVHHIFEWSTFPALDPKKMQNVLKIFDFYGYSKDDPHSPITSPDDKRNLVVLCELHHRGEDNGVHAITFPIWIALSALKPGVSLTKQIKVIQEADKKLQKPKE